MYSQWLVRDEKKLTKDTFLDIGFRDEGESLIRIKVEVDDNSLGRAFLSKMSMNDPNTLSHTTIKKPFSDFDTLYFGHDERQTRYCYYPYMELKEDLQQYEKPLVKGTIGMHNLIIDPTRRSVSRGNKFFYIYMDGSEQPTCQTLPFLHYIKHNTLKNAFGRITEGLESLEELIKNSKKVLEIKYADIKVINQQ